MKTRIPTRGGTGRYIEIEEIDGELWMDVDPEASCPSETTSGTFLDVATIDQLVEVLREWRSRQP